MEFVEGSEMSNQILAALWCDVIMFVSLKINDLMSLVLLIDTASDKVQAPEIEIFLFMIKLFPVL